MHLWNFGGSSIYEFATVDPEFDEAELCLPKRGSLQVEPLFPGVDYHEGHNAYTFLVKRDYGDKPFDPRSYKISALKRVRPVLETPPPPPPAPPSLPPSPPVRTQPPPPYRVSYQTTLDQAAKAREAAIAIKASSRWKRAIQGLE